MANSDPATSNDSDDDFTTDTDVDIARSGDATPPPPSDSPPFTVGEKALAYHTKQLYEVKVEQIELQMDWRFFIHYMGWSRNWDEWVGINRLMKFTKENVHKQQMLKEKQGEDMGRSPGPALQTRSISRGKKRKNNSVTKGSSSMKGLMDIQMPSTLKKQLVEDCAYITHLGKLVGLPRSPNVDAILKNYLDYRSRENGKISESVGEILNGLVSYFNNLLHAKLLYKNERQQYQEAIKDDISPSTVYGAEHLLRLFVKLPEILHHVNIEEETLSDLQRHFVDFLKFLQDNRSSFFLSTY